MIPKSKLGSMTYVCVCVRVYYSLFIILIFIIHIILTVFHSHFFPFVIFHYLSFFLLQLLLCTALSLFVLFRYFILRTYIHSKFFLLTFQVFLRRQSFIYWTLFVFKLGKKIMIKCASFHLWKIYNRRLKRVSWAIFQLYEIH